MRKQIVGLVVLLALILTVIVWQMPRETIKIDKIKSRDVHSSASNMSVSDELIAPEVAVSQPPEEGALVLEAPPALTVTEVTREEGNEELIKSAPEWLRDKLRREGFPPASLNSSDSYREVTYLSPNNDGEIRTLKAQSVESMFADDGTRIFVICMKGGKPFTNADNGMVIVGPVVNPGGDK